MIRLALFTIVFSCLLQSSENATPHQLLHFAANLSDSDAKITWYKSARLGDLQGAETLFNEASEDTYWMAQLALLLTISSSTTQDAQDELLKALKARAAYFMATTQANKRERLFWYERAASFNHAQSQFELALLRNQDTEARLRLLTQSAKNAYEPAILTLAQYSLALYDKEAFHSLRQKEDSELNLSLTPKLLRNDLSSPDDLSPVAPSQSNKNLKQNALYWLEKSSSFDTQSAFELGVLQWQLDNPKQASKAFIQAKSLGATQADQYLTAVKDGPSTTFQDLFSPTNASLQTNNECLQKLQFIASSLHTRVRAEQIKKRFESDERFTNLPICISEVAWLDEDHISCESHPDSRRVECDLSAFAGVKQQPKFTHLVVFADSGRAYVQRGVMYLDRFDAYSVFVHELAHFAGFVDEYALSEQMAKVHCTSENAPNLAIADILGELDKAKLDYWQTMSNELVEPTESRTCEQFERASFKPIADITFLEHHDIEYVPELYKRLWQVQLEKQKYQVHASQEFLLRSRILADETLVEHWQTFIP